MNFELISQHPEGLWWLLLGLPLGSALVGALLPRAAKESAVWLSVLSAFTCALVAGFLVARGVAAPPAARWLDTGGPLVLNIGMVADGLARLMILVVTWVGFLIHVFSLEYMNSDSGKGRFFSCLSLFMFSMTGIVLSDNLVMTFIFWELVGVSSYLLIGFWFERPAATAAANKAFIVNRIGDFGFMIGILAAWQLFGVLDFASLERIVEAGLTPDQMGWLTLVGFGLLCGAMGKSAQMPLHVWLPDAMEGPTPVSALIHAATMVAAGVYFLCRIYFLIEPVPVVMHAIAGIGCVTALFAALVATQQNDIKRILAYSTLSQLGYMVMAVGCHVPEAAMFHLTTHAFFKALLFLAAGSVIHSLHHEQDIWKMGGLLKSMPITGWTFAIGTLALMGLPPLSGFWSKEAILAGAFDAVPAAWFVATLTAGLTAFYMTRLFGVAFLGRPRSDTAEHAHETSGTMTGPLVVLAGFSIVAGFGASWGAEPFILAMLGDIGHAAAHGAAESHTHLPVLIGSLLALALGAFLGWHQYVRKKRASEHLQVAPLRDKLYIDELYRDSVVRANNLAAVSLDWFDRTVIGGVGVRGVMLTAKGFGHFFRLLESGNLQGYAFLFGLGAALLLASVMGR